MKIYSICQKQSSTSKMTIFPQECYQLTYLNYKKTPQNVSQGIQTDKWCGT